MALKLDFIIFGATGFTGNYVLKHALKLFKDVSWGIAGRNETKLKQALLETAKNVGITNLKNIPIIRADVEEEQTIVEMTRQCKVLINCCGPYVLYKGEFVVKCCIENGTHYVDVSAEELFIKNLQLKYQQYAEEKGVYVVNLCGFNSVPYDLGVIFLENAFQGTLNSVELYMNTRVDSKNSGPSINYTTWISLVNTLAKYRQLKKAKKEFKVEKPIELTPKLSTRLPHRVKEGLALPFPGSDEEAIRRTQMNLYKTENKRPVQVRNYMIMKSFQALVITAVLGLLCFILAQFSFGRSILLKYPEFFSHGTFSHTSPSEDLLNRRFFFLTLKGKGWSNVESNKDKQYNEQPSKEIIGLVSGVNPAYGFTALATVLCALTILLELKKLPARGGIYTPGAVFAKTSIIDRLQDNGVNFEVISRTDLK